MAHQIPERDDTWRRCCIMSSRQTRLGHRQRKLETQFRTGARRLKGARAVLLLFVGLAAASFAIHHRLRGHKAPEDVAITEAAAVPSLDETIARAVGYLIRICDPNGRFLYRQNLDGVSVEPRYNVLRHAGAVYALADYHHHTKDEDARGAVLRAAGYLLRHHVKPLETQPELLAVWSLPDEETRDGRPLAKLGGAALGLIALIEARRIDADAVPMDTLESLGRFLTFMQRPSGGFFSRYDESLGADRYFVSLYYPGEAILALTMLFEQTHDPRWLNAAAKGTSFLIQEREHVPVERLPADHWLMIASARLEKHLPGLTDASLTRGALLRHNHEVARMMLAEQARVTEEWASGSFVADGRSTPTATRLEGLLALYGWLDADDPLRPEIADAAATAVAFLRRCQVTTGPAEGGITRALRKLNTESTSFNSRQSEIRIDYVQHALSGWLEYRAHGLDAPARALRIFPLRPATSFQRVMGGGN